MFCVNSQTINGKSSTARKDIRSLSAKGKGAKRRRIFLTKRKNRNMHTELVLFEICMKKSEKIIKELEAELEEYTKQTESMDMSKVQHPAKWFARMSFYQAQAFVKFFEWLEKIEDEIKQIREEKSPQS